MSIIRTIKLGLGSAAIVASGAVLAGAPAGTALAQTPSCGGMRQPVCATATVCVGVPNTYSCRTNYYYFE
jgi:hypothetical protein